MMVFRTLTGKWMKIVRVCLGALLLSGCLSTVPLPMDHAIPWATRYAAMTKYDTWFASGSVMIDYDTPDGDQNWDVRFRWTQTKTGYALRLMGPFGKHVATIRVDRRGARLVTADGDRKRAKTVAQLMQRQWNMNFPVAALKYWLRGLKVPRPAVLVWDHQQRLLEIKQLGWEVDYTRYTAVNGIDLPHQLVLTHYSWTVHIGIESWKMNKQKPISRRRK